MFIAAIEQGPIRPPSEAHSLLLRVTRNCPWNRCEFCHIYKGTRFSLRTAEEVKKDIATVKGMVAEIRQLSLRHGFGGEVNLSLAKMMADNPLRYGDGYRSVIAWLHYGGKNVFLQDADNLILKTNELLDILTCLKETFPTVERITSYSRARTVARKSPDDLKALRQAGLSRLHLGLESGHDPVLELVRKGTTAREIIDAGIKVKEAGISLSEYIMPGLGGKAMWKEHAIETARVLNLIDPDFIRVRTMKVLDMMPLHDKIVSGEMELLNDDDIIAELKLLIEHLEGINSCIVSDHMLNLLEELEGKFPEAKPALLATIDRYLALADRERANFRLGRRAGFYRSLDDMQRPGLRAEVDAIIRRIEAQTPGGLDRAAAELMGAFI